MSQLSFVARYAPTCALLYCLLGLVQYVFEIDTKQAAIYTLYYLVLVFEALDRRLYPADR
jgi:hypothetical protein